MDNHSGKLRVPSEVILFIKLLTIIISGQSPVLLLSSYVTAINKNDNKRRLIGYIWIEKISQFLTLQYVKISVKTAITKSCYYFHYILEVNHSLQKDRSSITNIWQDSEFSPL